MEHAEEDQTEAYNRSIRNLLSEVVDENFVLRVALEKAHATIRNIKIAFWILFAAGTVNWLLDVAVLWLK